VSDSGDRDFKKKESTQEKEFVARQEQESLRGLLHKLERDSDPSGTNSSAALDKILAAHGVKSSTKLQQDLLKWRQSSH
jgi:hypothetical protein